MFNSSATTDEPLYLVFISVHNNNYFDCDELIPQPKKKKKKLDEKKMRRLMWRRK